jgi:uncharacterized membrane protein
MNSPKDHPLVNDYLDRFDAAAQKLGAERRARLREDIASHLREATTPTMSDSHVIAVINALGTPESIVAEEMTNEGVVSAIALSSKGHFVRVLFIVLAVVTGVGALVVMVPSTIDYLTAPGLYFSAFVWTLGASLALACVILAIAASRYGRSARSV